MSTSLRTRDAEVAEKQGVLPGHGNATDPTVYNTNVAWLTTAGELPKADHPHGLDARSERCGR